MHDDLQLYRVCDPAAKMHRKAPATRRRRCDSATPAGASIQTPESSGPRCEIASAAHGTGTRSSALSASTARVKQASEAARRNYLNKAGLEWTY
jgi:hypothetical protein